jgi:hypothetical protein
MVTTQVPVPEHPSPLQLLNLSLLDAGTAARVTRVFSVNGKEQVEPQLIPAGVLLIVPLPAPALETLRTNVFRVKVAVTDLAAVIGTWQEPVPEQYPLQPVKVEPAAGVADRVTVMG